MKEPKTYYCGNGEGMFEDDKNGHWVEYSEHKAIVEVLTEQLRKHAVVGRSEQLFCSMAGKGFCPYEYENGKCKVECKCTNHTTK